MNHRILVTRPNSDRTTRYLSEWAKKAIELASKKGDIILDLYKNKANRKQFESMIRRNTPSFIFINGHGNEVCVTGQNEEVLVEADHNENILSKSVIYAVSCSSGKTLGKNSVKAGAYSYIGYEDKFIFLFDEKKRTRPLEDKVAGPFLESSNQVAVSLIKGHTAGEAFASSQKCFMRKIQKLLSSGVSVRESSALRYLLWNKQFQVCIGNPSATI